MSQKCALLARKGNGILRGIKKRVLYLVRLHLEYMSSSGLPSSRNEDIILQMSELYNILFNSLSLMNELRQFFVNVVYFGYLLEIPIKKKQPISGGTATFCDFPRK